MPYATDSEYIKHFIKKLWYFSSNVKYDSKQQPLRNPYLIDAKQGQNNNAPWKHFDYDWFRFLFIWFIIDLYNSELSIRMSAVLLLTCSDHERNSVAKPTIDKNINASR